MAAVGHGVGGCCCLDSRPRPDQAHARQRTAAAMADCPRARMHVPGAARAPSPTRRPAARGRGPAPTTVARPDALLAAAASRDAGPVRAEHQAPRVCDRGRAARLRAARPPPRAARPPVAEAVLATRPRPATAAHGCASPLSVPTARPGHSSGTAPRARIEGATRAPRAGGAPPCWHLAAAAWSRPAPWRRRLLGWGLGFGNPSPWLIYGPLPPPQLDQIGGPGPGWGLRAFSLGQLSLAFFLMN